MLCRPQRHASQASNLFMHQQADPPLQPAADATAHPAACRCGTWRPPSATCTLSGWCTETCPATMCCSGAGLRSVVGLRCAAACCCCCPHTILWRRFDVFTAPPLPPPLSLWRSPSSPDERGFTAMVRCSWASCCMEASALSCWAHNPQSTLVLPTRLPSQRNPTSTLYPPSPYHLNPSNPGGRLWAVTPRGPVP